MTLWCRMLPWQIWLCFCFVQDEREGGQSLLIMTWVCNPTLRLFSSQGDGWAGDHREEREVGGCICKQIREEGCPFLTSHLVIKSLCSLLCDLWTKESLCFTFFLKKGKCRGNVPPSVSSESRVEMSQQKDLVLFFLYVFVEWLIRDESSMRSSDRGPKWAQDNYSVKGDVFNPDHEPTFM